VTCHGLSIYKQVLTKQGQVQKLVMDWVYTKWVYIRSRWFKWVADASGDH